MSQIQIRDIDDQPIPLIDVRLSLGHKSSDEAYDDKRSDMAGNLSFPVTLPSNDGYTLWVNYANVDEDFIPQSVYVPGKLDAQDVKVTLLKQERQRALITGYYANIYLKGESAFMDLSRKLQGEDIRPLLRQSLEVGSNGRRVFLMSKNTAAAAGLPDLDPDNYPNYYDVLEQMLQEYAEYGLYLYGSVFPDNGLFPGWAGQIQKQIDHWNRVGTIAQKYTNWWAVELTNEWDAHPFNNLDRAKFSPIPGVISCAGSMGSSGADPMPDPQWNVCDYHPGRRYPNTVVDLCFSNHPSRLFQGKALMSGEPLRFGDGGETNPRIAKEIAGSTRGTGAAIVFHSTSGGFSKLYTDNELDCAHAFFDELVGT